MHETVQESLVVRCIRCNTTRQRHVPLAMQRCPVRTCWTEAGEVAECTAAYGAWVKALKAMHGHGSRDSAADAGAVQAAPAAVHEEPAERREVLEPRVVSLRPFRPHVMARIGEADVCMMCFGKAPRHKAAAWKAECCDGAAPLGSCPKHILTAVCTVPVVWPPRKAERGADICAFARQWHEGRALKALRPPKRRVAAGKRPPPTLRLA